MKYNSIFIANIGEEDTSLIQMSKISHQPRMIEENYSLSERFIYADTDNRVLVTPHLLNKEFVEDASKLMGFKNFLNLSLKITQKLLCLSLLADKPSLKVLETIIAGNPDIEVISAVASGEFFLLVDFWKKKGLRFKTPEAPVSKTRWTTAYFDSKAGFRQTVLWLNHAFPTMPHAMVCTRPNEIMGWVEYFLNQGKHCLLKTNRGSAGVGIKIIKKTADLDGILEGTPYWQEEPVVVEEFIEPDLAVCGGSPSVEFKVGDKIDYLYTCGMRIEQRHFKGVELGRGAVPLAVEQKVIASGKALAEFFRQAGYRGFFDIDWVYGKNSALFPIEANLRHTGGTHVWETGKRLLGNNFLKEYYLASRSLVEAPAFKNRPYAQIKPALHDLFYPIKNKKEGIILTYANDFYFRGKLGYMVIAASRQRAYEIEEKFLRRLV